MIPLHDLESVWKLREEALYPSLFGQCSRGIFVLEQEDFIALGADSIDPRWLFLGVFEFAPTSSRSSWAYITSGGSTPWEQAPEEYDSGSYSGLGIELLLESTEQCDWAIRVLKRILAYHVLVAHGRFGDRSGIDYGARIPIGGSIDGEASLLSHVIALEPLCVSTVQSLPSGRFDLIQLVGVTAKEIAFAKANRTHDLAKKLAEAGIGVLTDPNRSEIVV